MMSNQFILISQELWLSQNLIGYEEKEQYFEKSKNTKELVIKFIELIIKNEPQFKNKLLEYLLDLMNNIFTQWKKGIQVYNFIKKY